MRCLVENGLAGCRLALELGAVAVIVDALRASAMLASLLHYGAREVLVVREVAQAFSERERRPGALLAGERGGPMVPGFDLGNSPLQQPPQSPLDRVIFSSSNCSRCCVGVEGVPAAFLGTTVNARATARAVHGALRECGASDVALITAGAVEDEVRFTLEDHLAAGALLAALSASGGPCEAANDRARACRLLFGDGDPERLREAFRSCDNGSRLTALGLGADVDFAARMDVFEAVPRIVEWVALGNGGRGALLRPAVC